MLGIEIHWSGDLRFLKEAIERTKPGEMQTRVFAPWVRWVTGWRIPEMYRHRGRVSGADGQMQWPVLKQATRQQKSGPSNMALTSSTAPGSNRMMNAYKVVTRRLSDFGYRFTISNEARSQSKWSKGFDYPSALHTGWPEYDVRPRSDGPGFLAWQLKSGAWVFARKTHPQGAPPRPHIRFFGYDVTKLGKLALEYILTGRTTELDYHEPIE